MARIARMFEGESKQSSATSRPLPANAAEPDWDALPPVLYVQKRLQTPFKTERHDPAWFSRLTPAARLVALAIADRMHRPNARGEDQCWCSKDDIAERATVDKRSVQRALRELKELQYPLFVLSQEKHRSYTFTLVRRPVAYRGLRLMRSTALRAVGGNEAGAAIRESDSAGTSTPASLDPRPESPPRASSEARACPPTPEFLEMCRIVRARVAAERQRDQAGAGDKLSPSNGGWVSLGRLMETNWLPRREADCLPPGDKLTPEVHPLKETPVERNRCRGDPRGLSEHVACQAGQNDGMTGNRAIGDVVADSDHSGRPSEELRTTCPAYADANQQSQHDRRNRG
ncbi:MAG: hypothetical protein GEU99_05065 [Luteitalea sp.]|nr:hypothetical protein [Luteitalea sp.]